MWSQTKHPVFDKTVTSTGWASNLFGEPRECTGKSLAIVTSAALSTFLERFYVFKLLAGPSRRGIGELIQRDSIALSIGGYIFHV